MMSDARLLAGSVGQERITPALPLASPGTRVRPLGRRGAAVLVLAPYLLYLATTPYERFPIISTLHVERILVLLLAAACVLGSGARPKMARVSWLWGGLYCLMLVSYALSPYAGTESVQWWFTEYWKILVLYFLVLWAIRTWADLSFVIKTLAVVGVAYQAYSWLDFAAGGSYVYQQGMRRIMGVWSGGGLGAANAFAILALFTLPSAAYCRRIAGSRFKRLLWLGAEGLCLFTILYSGTRAGAVCAVFYFLVAAGPKGFKWFLLGAPLAIMVAYLTLPPDVWHRHTSWISSSYDQTKQSDRTAEESADGRIDGIVDGFSLGKQRPIVGYGPNSSAIARAVMHGVPVEHVLATYNNPREDAPLALHNLWGQVAAELGFVGLALFVVTLGAFLMRLRQAAKVHTLTQGHTVQAAIVVSLFQLLVTYIAYGMFSHTLYRYQWVLTLALSGAAISLSQAQRRYEASSK